MSTDFLKDIVQCMMVFYEIYNDGKVKYLGVTRSLRNLLVQTRFNSNGLY